MPELEGDDEVDDRLREVPLDAQLLAAGHPKLVLAVSAALVLVAVVAAFFVPVPIAALVLAGAGMFGGFGVLSARWSMRHPERAQYVIALKKDNRDAGLRRAPLTSVVLIAVGVTAYLVIQGWRRDDDDPTTVEIAVRAGVGILVGIALGWHLMRRAVRARRLRTAGRRDPFEGPVGKAPPFV